MNLGICILYKMMGYFWGQMNYVRKIIEIKKLFEVLLFVRIWKVEVKVNLLMYEK